MRTFIVSIMILLASPALACNVCHSKNPAMVNMHKGMEFAACFDCHGPSSKRSLQGRKDERAAEPMCAQCHAKKSGSAKAAEK